MLKEISGPEDVRSLSYDELVVLSMEMRDVIVKTVNANGGHMASNLGIVELTIALHRVFDSPRDKIIFDISHQTYPHKLLTGRYPEFHTLRTRGGLSGFAELDESEHDILAAGHAGTAPAFSLGVALGTENQVACVVGDGSLTSGIAWEGLNNILAARPKNMMVILNDNGMSISENMGWLATWRDRFLSHLRSQLETDGDFRVFTDAAERLAQKVPFGEIGLELMKATKGTIERAILPSIGTAWEEMGFAYLGPVNGHDIAEIETILRQAQGIKGKVPFVHVLTRKGRGYPPAEQDPRRFHQPTSPKGATWSGVFADTLIELMRDDDRIRAISAAMLDGTGLTRVQEAYPDRVLDVGIAEQAAVSVAAGMARQGLRPVVCLYSTFFQRAIDQLLHDVALNGLPVVFGIDRAGLVGQDGKTHHGVFDLSLSRLAPGVVVASPSNEAELARLLATALRAEVPFVIRYPRGEPPGVEVPEKKENLAIGTWLPVGQLPAAPEAWIVATGSMVSEAVKAAEILNQEGKVVGVLNALYIKPVDKKRIRSSISPDSPGPSLVVVEENVGCGGLGAAVMEAVAEMNPTFPPRVRLVNVGDRFVPHGSASELKEMVGLTADKIAQACREVT